MAAFRSSRGLGWGGGCLIAAVVGVILLAGTGFFGFRAMMSEGADELRAQLEDNPVILEHIGEIESIESETIKSGKLLSEDEIETDWWLWTIRGTKGSGLLKVRTPTDEESEILFKVTEGELQLDGGSTYALFEHVEGPGKPKQPALPDDPPESLPNPK